MIILKQMSEAEYNIYASGSTDYAEALAKAQNIFLEKAKEEALKQREYIEKVIKNHGINIGYMFISEPDFVNGVLNLAAGQSSIPPGFLFDVAHIFISADAKTTEARYNKIENYIDAIMNVSKGRTYQMHLAVPFGDDKSGYIDSHRLFAKGDILAERLLDIAKKVINSTPELKVVTFETRTNFGPVEHAKAMVKQADYVLNELGLSVSR